MFTRGIGFWPIPNRFFGVLKKQYNWDDMMIGKWLDICINMYKLLWKQLEEGLLWLRNWVKTQIHLALHTFVGFSTFFDRKKINRRVVLNKMAGFLQWVHPQSSSIFLSDFPSKSTIQPLGPPIFRTPTGWWFGTFFIFPYIGKNNPKWLSYFSEGLKPPTSQ